MNNPNAFVINYCYPRYGCEKVWYYDGDDYEQDVTEIREQLLAEWMVER